jgi:cellulose synthase/poly-beta-1,6-N-acetylglucosamine synthase-like glycosyltransferase
MDETPPTPAEPPTPHPVESPPIEVTVLITAHNEEETIQSCLRAMMAQDFPMERVEILLIDDRSRDATVERARALKLPCLRVISIDQPPGRLTARQAALDLGIREARGEVVMITDGDARPPREWIRELSGHLSFRDGAVTAPVVFGGNHHLIARYQSCEALLRFTLFRLFDRHGWNSSVDCTNLALRRATYIEAGGFEAVGFNPAEGASLAQLMRKGDLSIRYLIEPIVQKMDSGSMTALIARSRRKARAQMPVLTTLVLAIVLSNLALLVWSVLPVQNFFVAMFVLGLRYSLGAAVLVASIGQYRRYTAVGSVFLFEPFLTFIGLCVYLSLLFAPGWRWADLSYGRKGPRGLKQHDA